ncbi:ABC transporter, ATP-binding protein [Trichuris suis]|nr:ABC transporter, ATP-binding protein [Trichuris suis]
MNEILNAVRVIKMYAWEYPFMTLVHDARAEEMQKLRRHALCQAIVIGSYYVTGRIALLGALAAYVLTNKAVTSEVVFVGAAMFNAARLTLSLYLPFAVQNYLELSVTLNRIQKFLLLADKTENRTQLTESLIEKQKQGMVSMKSVSASWDEVHASVVEADSLLIFCFKDVKDHIVSVTFSVQPGQLLAIVGPLGSGKSMILQTLLKEVVHNKGEVVVNGSIAYVPQEAWLFPGTIRQNVLFGRDMDVERYRDALNVSALMRDLIRLPKGDLTVIGDKGTTLSGGQKARINLARAVYQDADIYLLDDPLSAVDTAVGKSIFESCLLGHLKNKTRILVTHQLQYLKSADNGVQVGYGTYEQLIATGDQFTHILQETELSYHGKVQLVSESLSENDEENEELYDFEISSEEKHLVEGSAPVVYFRVSRWSLLPAMRAILFQPSGDNRTDSTYQESRKLLEPRDDVNKAVNGELPTATHDAAFNVLEEYTGSKGVSYKTYFTYLREIGHPCVLTCLLSMAILVQGFYTFCDWWLHQWSNEEDIRKFMSMYPLNITMAEERKKRLSFFTGFDSVEHLKIWTCMIVTLLLVSVLQAIVLRFSLLRSAFRLHSRMFHHVIRASIVFFDRNPVGRILNRFSKDTNVMDELLAFVFFDFFLVGLLPAFSKGAAIDFSLKGSLVLLSYVLVNGLLNPWLFLVLAPLLCAFAFLRNYYMRSARALKRLEAAVRSPLYSHFSATISGLAVIRAFNAEEKVIGNYLYHQNTHSTTWSAFLATSRLFSVCVDCLSAVYVTLVAFVSVFTASDAVAESGTVGLSLFYASSLTGFLQFMLRQSTEVENMVLGFYRRRFAYFDILIFCNFFVKGRISLITGGECHCENYRETVF